MSKRPKAQSVDKQGEADGFSPPMAYQPRVLDGGYTRIDVSVPPEKLSILHKAIISTCQAPFKLRYVRMIDRQRGQLPKQESWVVVELSQDRLQQICDHFNTLFYHDGRNQIWIQGASGEQLVLDELGMLYVYPDDFSFRELLNTMGWVEADHESMDTRDYVLVNLCAEADQEERELFQSLGMVRWDG